VVEDKKFVVIRDPILPRSHLNQPTRCHSVREEAESEALRLATVNRDVKFYVARLVSEARIPKKHDGLIRLDDDDCPF
jgi:hypothetical protein